MTARTAKPITGPAYSAWLDQVRAKFIYHRGTADELRSASEIFSFEAAFEDGLSPQQAYDAFDLFVCEEV